VVVAIISIISAIAVPNIFSILGSERKNTSIMISYITEITNDAISNGRVNYLCIHMGTGKDEKDYLAFEYSDSKNSMDVYNLVNNKFKINKRTVLKHREFPEDFVVESIKVGDLPEITSGNIFIPFYSDGLSETFEIKIKSDNAYMTLKKYRALKQPVLNNEKE